MQDLQPEEAQALLHDWEIWARDEQLPPPGSWVWWLILAGRGYGKTRSGAQYIQARVESGAGRRIALVGPTAADARDTMVEGESGLLAIAHPAHRPIYEPSKRRLTWPNGAIATLFSAEEPERLRGPQHDTAWCDELGAWKHLRATWDMLAFGFRSGVPQGIITTTPRPSELLRELLADPEVTVTKGSTYDNAANLAPSFLARLKKKYEGTRLGRQELLAQLLEDTPGALWTTTLIERHRRAHHPELSRLAVAVDPQAADPNRAVDDEAAETGIVAGGIVDGRGYVLRDASGSFTPAEWGETAVLLHDELGADCIVAEANQGGEMVRHVIVSSAEKLFREGKRKSKRIVVRLVHASRGKHTRAEPVSALYEQGLVHHVGCFPALEDQQTTWVPGQKSPDRMDALVWLITYLMVAGPSNDDGDVRGWLQELEAAGVGARRESPDAFLRPPSEDEDEDDNDNGGRY